MRIGIDGIPFQSALTGVGRYVFSLCKYLDITLPDAEFLVYSNRPIKVSFFSNRWKMRIDSSVTSRYMKHVLWLKSRCGNMCKRDRLNMFWGTGSFLPCLPISIKKVLTVYDLTFKVVPHTMPFHRWLSYWLFFGGDLYAAEKVFVISRGTSDRLFKYYGRRADAVIPPAVDTHFHRYPLERVQECLHRYKIVSPYILSVGTLEPRKNTELLIATFLSMKEEGLIGNHQLVLVGGKGWKDRKIRSILGGHGSAEVISLGYVPDNDLPLFYSGADVFVFPSLYEGFGMPVLEAKCCGAKIVTSDCPELRQAGGEGAVYITPNEAGIRQGILKALEKSYLQSPIQTRDSFSWRDGATALSTLFTNN